MHKKIHDQKIRWIKTAPVNNILVMDLEYTGFMAFPEVCSYYVTIIANWNAYIVEFLAENLRNRQARKYIGRGGDET